MWFSWSIDHLHNFGAQNFIVKFFWRVPLIGGRGAPLIGGRGARE